MTWYLVKHRDNSTFHGLFCSRHFISDMGSCITIRTSYDTVLPYRIVPSVSSCKLAVLKCSSARFVYLYMRAYPKVSELSQ